MCNTEKLHTNTYYLYLNEMLVFIFQMLDISLHIMKFVASISEIGVTSNKQLSPWQVNHSIISFNLCSH